ncbi:hypothetical protein [Dyella sp.]|jgi:hypothetical protein|uniref:hypothetical protein n=1 Tax=Dyella sp. TaxID=1869338 RepID=UPI002D78C38A|nr:hypothetical protein [Dyella sp.]HET6432675.1 hypothetical protein [Dyella sp.]
MNNRKHAADRPEDTDATKTPDARLGPADAGKDGERAADGAGRDRLDLIEQADERTEESARERARDVGAETPGDPGEQMSQPLGDGNYLREGNGNTPLREQGPNGNVDI